MTAESFPFIICAYMKTGDGKTEEVADRWRKSGYTVRVFDRTVRAGGAGVIVRVAVATGRRAS